MERKNYQIYSENLDSFNSKLKRFNSSFKTSNKIKMEKNDQMKHIDKRDISENNSNPNIEKEESRKSRESRESREFKCSNYGPNFNFNVKEENKMDSPSLIGTPYQKNSDKKNPSKNNSSYSYTDQYSDFILPKSKNWIYRPHLKFITVDNRINEYKRRSYCDKKILIDEEEYIVKDPLSIVTKNYNPVEEIKKKMMAKELQTFLNAQIQIKNLKDKQEKSKMKEEIDSFQSIKYNQNLITKPRIIRHPFITEKAELKCRNSRRYSQRQNDENNKLKEISINQDHLINYGEFTDLKSEIENLKHKLQNQVSKLDKPQVHIKEQYLSTKNNINNNNKLRCSENNCPSILNYENNTCKKKKINLFNDLKKLQAETPIFIPISEKRKTQTKNNSSQKNNTISSLCGKIIQQIMNPTKGPVSQNNQSRLMKSNKYRNFKFDTTIKKYEPKSYEMNSLLLNQINNSLSNEVTSSK